MTEHDLAPDEEGQAPVEVADFDAFFAEETATRPRERLTLYGHEYTLPESLPLMFTLQAERVQGSADTDDVRRMLALLFGRDVLDHWAEKGMTDRQLGVLLIYAVANIKTPGSLSMHRAAVLHDEQEQAKAEGKAAAPNRAARRKAAKPRSSGKRS